MIELLGNLKYMYLIYNALRVHVGRMLRTSGSWLDEFSYRDMYLWLQNCLDSSETTLITCFTCIFFNVNNGNKQ